MTTPPEAGPPPPRSPFLTDVLSGLSATPRTLPCKYFYDQAGSRLFEEICRTPEYYPTRTETAILDRYANEIAERCGTGGCLIEPGAGSGEKTRILLRHLRPEVYVPSDISGDYLAGVAESIAGEFPDCLVLPLVADFTRSMTLPRAATQFTSRTLFFPGSTIGNFTPADAAALLTRWKPLIGEDGTMLIGVDLVKDPAILEAAYDDAAGVTAAFNRNLLVRVRDELGGDVDPEAFAHRAVFNVRDSRIEMHLVSTRDQTICVGGEEFAFEEGESIHTENSHKFTQPMVDALAAEAGLRVRHVYTDDDGLFSIQTLKPSG